MRHGERPATLVLGMAFPLPEAGKPAPRSVETLLFVDVRDEGADVRASRLAREIANAVVAKTGGEYGDGILAGWPPEAEYRHLWRVMVELTPTGKTSADMAVDYWCAPGTPPTQVRDMWAYFNALKRLGRPQGGRRTKRG